MIVSLQNSLPLRSLGLLDSSPSLSPVGENTALPQSHSFRSIPASSGSFLAVSLARKKFPSSFFATSSSPRLLHRDVVSRFSLRVFSTITPALHAARASATAVSPSTSPKNKKKNSKSGEVGNEKVSISRKEKKGKPLPSAVPPPSASPSSSKMVHRSGTSSPGILFSDDEEVVEGSAALLAQISAALHPASSTMEQDKTPEDAQKERYLQGGGIGTPPPRSPLDVVHHMREMNDDEFSHQRGGNGTCSASSSTALPSFLTAEEEENEQDEGAMDFFRGATAGNSEGAPGNEAGRSAKPSLPSFAATPPKWVPPASYAVSSSLVPNVDEEGRGGEMNALAAASLEQDEDDRSGERRRRRHASYHFSPSHTNGPDNMLSGSSGGSTNILGDSSGSGNPSVNESVLCAIDMLCDDLFACKTDVLRSFARARHIFHGSKTVMVTRLIERAHADAHGENMDLSVTRRLLGDVFEGSGHEVRVSGIRSVWTNRSLEASHIEAACVRHFQFQALANSNKTLVVRRHGAETSRLTRKICRPFQESMDKVSEMTRRILERIQMLKAERSPGTPSSALLPLLFLEINTIHSNPPTATVLARTTHSNAGEEITTSAPTQKSTEYKHTKKHASEKDGDDAIHTQTAYNFEKIQQEVHLLVTQLTTTEIIGPFAAFLISYIRYGASRNLLSRVDVIEKLLQMGIVQPTIEEEDVDVDAVHRNASPLASSPHCNEFEDPSRPLSNGKEDPSQGCYRNGENGEEEEEEIGLRSLKNTPEFSATSDAVFPLPHNKGVKSDSSSQSSFSYTVQQDPFATTRSTTCRYGQETLFKLCSLFDDVVRLVRQRDQQTKAPGGTPSQRIAFDSPDFILLDVLDFATKPTSHWKLAYAPSWVHDIARTFTNWEICVRTDLQSFSDAPSYVFDTILVGVVHYYIVEKIYGRDGVSASDVVLSVRGGLKKAMEKMTDGNVERATAAAHELIAYVNASMENSRGFSGDFFIQVLSQMRGVADTHTIGSSGLHPGRHGGDCMRSSALSKRFGNISSSAYSRRLRDIHGERLEGGEDEEEWEDEDEEVPKKGSKEEEDEADLSLELSDDGVDGKEFGRAGKTSLGKKRNPDLPEVHAPTAPSAGKKRGRKKKANDEEVINPSHRYHKRVSMVLKEIGKTASRCTRAGNLLDILVRITEDVYFHYRFARVFSKLNMQDKTTIRLRKATHLQKTLAYFEKIQGIAQPISLEAITYLVLMLTYFAMRPHDQSAPALLRYDSILGLPELALVGLRERGTTTIRELRVAFPPQLSYRSWLMESDTKEKSVYRVLPSVAVKGPTNEAMLVSQAPMMRALDAISRVPWRIHKFILHIQEAMVREGYGFGKLRPAFYPLHYTSLHPGTVYYKVKKDELEPKKDGSARKKKDGKSNNKKEGKKIQEEKEVVEEDEQESLEEDQEEDMDSEAGFSSALQTTRQAGPDRDNESSIFDFEEAFSSSEDGEVVGCNIKQRMAFDFQQSVDWKALSDVRSSRTHYLQALRQARSIVQFSHLYFPNSMDFRGRMYPLPGRLNHTGSDPFRALLEYGDPKPLGKVGLYWLKVHLANKMGMTKLSFDERVHYVEEHISDVVQSAESPLSGDRWWQEASEPFQCLMACKELSDALKYSQGAEYFPSRLPVAVDGSYNGLQHYSAIGRDAFGAELVNLVPSDRPADAYTGILKEMLKVIEHDASMDHPVAQRCLGSGKGQDKNHIKRKTIKRPIMTQVYGVTGYGMSEQILEELGKQNKSHGLWTQADMKEMAIYLKDKVLDSLGITFRETQRCREWLREICQLVYSAQPNELRNALSWTTPLGLVVRQPYRVHRDDNLFTMQGLTRIPGDVIGAAGRKQLTAMAPNLIHSLDATHLAMTALEMQREGLSMMAVHDSYWTYACDLPKLSTILRQQFVHLYTEHDPLWELKEQWEEAFFFDLRRHGIVLPDPPSRGDLDLRVVLDSPYFFS